MTNNKTNTHLVILLHGVILRNETTKTKNYAFIQQRVKAEFPGARILFPDLPLKPFSCANPHQVINTLLSEVDKVWAEMMAGRTPNEAPPKVIIIGHSTGAVFARKLYVCACGSNYNTPIESEIQVDESPKPWAKEVERIILFAGMNRGWSINQHLYIKTAFSIRIAVVIGSLMRLFGQTPIGFQTKKGAPFITQMRLQWLSMLKHAPTKGVGNATVIQMLGTTDDLISPEDNIDAVTGANFIYLDVPMSDHITVIKMDESPAGKQRANVFKSALTQNREWLSQQHIMPEEQAGMIIDESITDVVFVIHGIRDTGYWTQKIARRVKALGDKTEDEHGRKRKFAMETSTYGYFPMLPFLMYRSRREKVEWLMDQYTQNKAMYPNATFSFIGHSNGTYLLAKAIKEYPACRFKHVVFAGSVVSSDFNWREMKTAYRIKEFYNFVATSDWVVAIFPKSFQVAKFQDIGSAGFDGFKDIDEHQELKFIPGGHGAAIEEKYWNEIAMFLINGKIASTIEAHKQPRNRFMTLIGRTAPLPFLMLIGILLLSGYGISQLPFMNTIEKIILAELLYIALLWKVITKI